MDGQTNVGDQWNPLTSAAEFGAGKLVSMNSEYYPGGDDGYESDGSDDSDFLRPPFTHEQLPSWDPFDDNLYYICPQRNKIFALDEDELNRLTALGAEVRQL